MDSYELFDDGTVRPSDYAWTDIRNRCDQTSRKAANSSATAQNEYALLDDSPLRMHLDPIRVEMTQVEAVPEPGTYVMFGVGAVVLGLRLYGRRRNRSTPEV